MGDLALEPEVVNDHGNLTRDRLLTIVLLIATGLALVACCLLVAPFVPALTWALALAVVAHPVHDRLRRRLHKEDLAAGLAVALIAVLLIGPLVLIAMQIGGQAAHGLGTLQEQIESGQWRSSIERNPMMANAVNWIEQQLDVRSAAIGLANAIRERIGAWLKGTAWMLMQIAITLFALFFFFRDRREIMSGLRSLVPLSNREADEVFHRIRGMIRATILGTVVVAFVQGSLGGLMFWFLGLPVPVLWALVMSIMAMIPTLGAPVVWVPAAAFLAAQGNWGKAVILVAWGMLAVGLIDNLLYPTLVGKEMQLHTLVVFLAVIGGLFLLGASGIVLGPVVLAITLALIDILRRRTAMGRPAEAPT